MERKKRQVCAVIELYFFPVAPPLIHRTSGRLPFRVHHHSNLTLPCLLSAIHYCGSYVPWHSANLHFNVTSI